MDQLTGKLLGIAIRSASRAPIKVLQEATVTCENGIQGDFRGRPGNRQVTLLGREAWEYVCSELGASLPWTTRRANLLIEGISLVESSGIRLQINNLILEVTGETFPCNRMDEALTGLRDALTPLWRGGATCRVIQSGTIKVGDEIKVEHLHSKS